MKKRITITLFFFSYLLIGQPLFCQTEKSGQVIYTVPEGWKSAKYQNGAILVPADLPAKESLIIQIMPSINFSGTMGQALEKSYDEACTVLQVTKMREVNGGNYNAQQPRKSFRGWEYIRCSGGIQVNNETPYPDEFGLNLFIVKIHSRFEQIAIIKSRNNCGLSRYYPSDRLKYFRDIENFLFSLQFADWQESAAVMGIAEGNGITGVWQGLSLSVGTPKPGAELGAELKVKQLIFFPNGQAYFGKNFPTEGLDELNTWIMAENNRRDWGTYEFKNGNGILKMPYGEIPLRMHNNKLIITTNKTDHGFVRQSPVDGARFKGTYALSEWNGKIPAITFTLEGKFNDQGALRVLVHEYVDCLNPALNTGSGTYEVKNHSVIFNYTDGRKIKIAFPGNGFDKNNSSPLGLVLSFNEDMLRMQ